MSIWSSLPTLVEKFDWSTQFSTMESYINGIVLNGFINGELKQFEVVQTAVLVMLVMAYVASAYVICAAVDAGVSVSRGFYSTYGGQSSIGNLLYLFEAFLIVTW